MNRASIYKISFFMDLQPSFYIVDGGI